MKLRGILGLAVVLIGAAAYTAPAKADVLADIKARNAFICGMSSNSPPWGYLDVKTQQIVGYEIDLCNMVGKALGVPVQLKEVSSSARVPEITQGRIDLLAGLLSYSKERAEQVDFSGAYINESFSFLVPASSEIKMVDELAGKRIGVVAGSFLEPLIPQRLPTARVVAFESQPANFVALQQGKIAGAAMRYSQAKALEASAGANVRPLRALPGALTFAASGFGIRKGEEAWKNFLNTFLTNLETSGEGQVLFDKWLGKNSVYKMDREFRFGQTME
jgi:polar amino acid transport system substrate-binding protein